MRAFRGLKGNLCYFLCVLQIAYLFFARPLWQLKRIMTKENSSLITVAR